MVIAAFRQIVELLDQSNPVAAAALARLSDERLSGILSHICFEIPHFVWQQERIWHELIVVGEEPLQPGDDDTENVFLGKMVHERVSVEQASLIFLKRLQIVVSDSHAEPND